MVAYNYIKLGKKLFPLNRSITGSDLRKTLLILKKHLRNLKILHIRSGKKVFDWKIPEEWNVRSAYIKDNKGKKLIDFKKNNLHLVSYSIPIKKKIQLNKLKKNLHFLKKQKNAIPYVTSYYKKYWGFCISYNQLFSIEKKYSSKARFEIAINSNFKKTGKLSYGELLIKGKSKKEILISTNICHPSMANNELSGPLVAAALVKHFEKKKNYLSKSIRFLFIPETIGVIAYINKNFKNLKKNVIGGYVLTCIGDDRNYSYMFSKYGRSLSDKAALKAFKQLKIKYKKYSFLKRESDERQYNSPFINLGLGTLMRTKYHSYPEYHTSLDNFDVVKKRGLLGGFKIVKQAINNLLQTKNDQNQISKKIQSKFLISKIICEPNLGKRNLYPKISEKNNNFEDPQKLLDIMQFADGTNSDYQISKLMKISLNKTKKLIKILIKNNLIEYMK